MFLCWFIYISPKRQNSQWLIEWKMRKLKLLKYTNKNQVYPKVFFIFETYTSVQLNFTIKKSIFSMLRFLMKLCVLFRMYVTEYEALPNGWANFILHSINICLQFPFIPRTRTFKLELLNCFFLCCSCANNYRHIS